MYLLKSVCDIVRTASDPQSPAKGPQDVPDDDNAFWGGIFEELEIGIGDVELDMDAANMMDVDEVVPGEGPGHWQPAAYVPTPEHHIPGIQSPDLTDEERALLRRGANLGMIDELELRYSGEQGITGRVGAFHMHFGWLMHRSWARVPPHELDVAVQVCFFAVSGTIEHPS